MSAFTEVGFSEAFDWTPTDASGAGLVLTVTAGNCRYIRSGNIVLATFRITYPATADVNLAAITGFPVAWKATPSSIYCGTVLNTKSLTLTILAGTGSVNAFFFNSNTLNSITNAQLTGGLVIGTLMYEAA